jgi:hypothetical protein
MLVVETIAKIRRAYFAQNKPIKTICREFRVSRRVVRKVIRSQAVERDKQWQRHSARNADDLRSTALRAGTYLPPGTESSNPPSSSDESVTNCGSRGRRAF